ncbi:MAG: hypothetical protein LBT01_00305 [Spirochaetaceae bacterium]|jgi:hypothetical protein|nr:hypothetical protein [Spirochaetaceae bacterium]
MNIVSYDSNNLPKVSTDEWASLDAIRDEDIDFSDIPEQNVSQFVPYTKRHQLKAPEAAPFTWA